MSQPFGDRAIETCPELVGAAAGFEERRIDQLDVDPAVLHWLDRAGDLDQLAGGDIRIGEGAGLDKFHAALGSICAA
jgi:hypothetical protein